MMTPRFACALALSMLLTGCGGGGGGGTGAGGSTSASSSSSGIASSSSSGSGGSMGTGGQAGTGGSMGTGGAPMPVTAAELLGLTSSCAELAGTTKFATDSGEAPTVPICALNGAVWWQADLDVDCDGGQSAACMNDPYYLPDTSATDSQGNPLDASTLPFFVIPLPSNGFDFKAHGIQLGSVGAVIYQGKLQYGIFGDEGPKGIIGEASYAMASLLGIDPDPSTGGADSGATYIVFTGPSGVVQKNEDHAEAAAIGEIRAKALLGAN